MKIKSHFDNRICPVYAIYTVDKIKHFLHIPYDGYEGLMVILETECDIVDNDTNQFISVKNYNGNEMLVHLDAYSNNLLDELIDHNPNAMIELKQRLMEREKSNI